jgi:NADPH-ferrihemoprotein reductase
MATYGEGEPTDNAISFYKWLKNEDEETLDHMLASTKYSVFGLGNRQYEHYNKMGKETDKLLEKLGASRIFDYGEGDDDGSLEEDFEEWKNRFWPSILKQFHPHYNNNDVSDDSNAIKKVDLQFQLEFLDKMASARIVANPVNPVTLASKANNSTRHYFTAVPATIEVNRELRSVANIPGKSEEDIGSTRHIELGISKVGIKYNTADNCAILPNNSTQSVEKLAAQLGYDLNQCFQLTGIDESESLKLPFPTPCSVREVLTNYIDIHGVPKHSTLTYLVPYVVDENQRAWLLKVVSKENRKAFGEIIEGAGKSLYSLLTHELSSSQIPLVDLLNIAPPLQPRYYTISSSSSVYPTAIHVTVSVTHVAMPSGVTVSGLCSSYLRDLPVGASCRVFIRASSFKLPSSLSTPIVMIGPGTGIAPMRALIQERDFRFRRQTDVKSVTNVLYFGCKRSDEDFIYADELHEYVRTGTLSALHLAFSREGSQKVYVQHLLQQKENATDLVSLLDAGAHIYVCGATAMGEDVLHAITQIIQTHKGNSIFLYYFHDIIIYFNRLLGLSKDDSNKYIKELQVFGRYVQELWTA